LKIWSPRSCLLGPEPSDDFLRLQAGLLVGLSSEQWRFCWLDEKESNRRAALYKFPELDVYVKPVKRKQNLFHLGDRWDALVCKKDGEAMNMYRAIAEETTLWRTKRCISVLIHGSH